MAVFYSNRGMAYASIKKFDTAIEDLTFAIGLDAGLAEAYLRRGEAYMGLGQDYEEDENATAAIVSYGRALADLQRAAELFPSNAAAYATWAEALGLRGDAYRKSGDFVRALQDLSEAVRLNPELVDAYVDRALTNAALGRDGRRRSRPGEGDRARLQPLPADGDARRGATRAVAGGVEG